MYSPTPPWNSGGVGYNFNSSQKKRNRLIFRFTGSFRTITETYRFLSFGQSIRMTEEHSSHKKEERLQDLPFTIKTIPRWIFLLLIRAYQLLISPMLPPDTCRFYPSCSRYTYQAIYRFGALRGTAMGVWRVLRCNPFNPGGYDPVPMRKESEKTEKMRNQKNLGTN